MIIRWNINKRELEYVFDRPRLLHTDHRQTIVLLKYELYSQSLILITLFSVLTPFRVYRPHYPHTTIYLRSNQS